MSKSNYIKIASFIFLVFGVVHALRLLNGWEAQIGGATVPMWISWLAILLAAYLAWQGFKMARGE